MIVELFYIFIALFNSLTHKLQKYVPYVEEICLMIPNLLTVHVHMGVTFGLNLQTIYIFT